VDVSGGLSFSREVVLAGQAGASDEEALRIGRRAVSDGGLRQSIAAIPRATLPFI
jgi:hypothetical protein